VSGEAVVAGVDACLGAVDYACLVEDVADVAANGVAADDEVVRDLLVALASGDKAEYFDLPR
jgi:hypothetical protein